MSFFYKAELSNQELFYKELKVYQHKKLLKCFIGDKIQIDILIKNLNSIIIENTNLTEKDISQLSFFDYFLLILYIRYTSIGDLIFAEIYTDQRVKLEISTNKLINEFHNFYKNTQIKTFILENLEINFTLPNIYSVIKLQEKSAQNNFFLYFIKNIKINNQIIDFESLNEQDIQVIFDNLPAKVTAQVIKQTTHLIKTINNFNILTFLPGLSNKVYFNLNIDNFCTLIRLLFGGDLLNLYENIFALSKYGNFSAEYIEQCTPGEYLFFVKKLEELARKQMTENTPPSDMSKSPFEDGLS